MAKGTQDQAPAGNGGGGGGPSGNVAALHKLIRKSAAEYAQLVQKQAELQTEKQAIVERIVSNGIDRKAFRNAVRLRDVDEDKRTAFDTSLELCREAMGIPAQGTFAFQTKPDAPQPTTGATGNA